MKCHCPHITINGHRYDADEIHHQCRKALVEASTEWERELYAFILEWMNDEEYIEAHTSGSTGKPKRIRLSKKSMVASARLTGDYFGFRPGQTALLCLSSAYIAGKMMIVRAIVWGLNLITVEPSGHPLKDVTEKIDFAAMVPLQVYNSLEDRRQLDLVNRLIIGGGAVDESLHLQLKDLNTECYSTYGMTETVSHVALKRLNGLGAKETFEALGNIRFSIDQRDCLVIHAAHLLEEPLITNDIVQLISETEFQWLGRYDNVVNSGGVKLMPETLEQKISGLLEVRFFLAGIPDSRLGERLVLIVEDEPWEEEPIRQFREKMNGLLKKYEQPKDIYFHTPFIETETGKLKRSETILQLTK